MTKKNKGEKSRKGVETFGRRFWGVLKNGLRDKENMRKVSHSKSTLKNAKRAKMVLQEFASTLGAIDVHKATPETSKFVMNLLHSYCYTGTPKSLSDDTVRGMVQNLRHFFLENGHLGTKNVNLKESTASGNPLIGNEDIKRLRASHRVYFAHIGRTKRRARPISVALVCEHAKRFWFGCGAQMDYSDVLLHPIVVTGLSVGLRNDEVSRMRIVNVTVVPAIAGTGSILLHNPESIKSSTRGREYEIREWPGNTKMRTSMIMDPFVALLSWMSTRGNRAGFLFCDVSD